MEEAPVTAATGALGPVIAKLAALVGTEYKLRWRTRRDVEFIRSKLKPVHSILWDIWERKELDAASMALKMEALDLADELDDAIFDFILSMQPSCSKKGVQTKIKASPFQDFKKRASHVSARCRSRWKEVNKPVVSRLFSRGKTATDDSRPGKPRAYPFVRKHILGLVDMVQPRDDLIKHLIREDEELEVMLQLKTVIIYGTAGMGKTTLADLVYEAIGDKFECRAFVSVTPGGNMREVLAKILQQVAPNGSASLAAGSQTATEEHLIGIISKFLKDRRYLVIIDDIWNWREWEVIMQTLKENNLGSRIVGTTRILDVSEMWRVNFEGSWFFGEGEKNVLYEMIPRWNGQGVWFYKIRENYIEEQMIDMKGDLGAEGFKTEHPIVRMCGGTPLAVCCMLSAVEQEREKQAQQGIHAKICDVQDDIEKHVMENGFQNTPGFEPLAESLQLGFDDLPHHMLKSCLLYCSMYPDGHVFDKKDLVRRWISQRFVYTEEKGNAYFQEFVKRGWFLYDNLRFPHMRMHPISRKFLRWKSRQDNFTTCSSEITPSCRIRRLCICSSRDGVAEDPWSVLDWYHIRSLVVCEGIERVPFDKLEGVRVLDLCFLKSHWKEICGLVRLRHMLGVNGKTISEIPPEIVRLQCLETLEVKCLEEDSGDGFAQRLPGFIGDLQQLRTLVVRGQAIKEVPREIGALQQLKTLRMRKIDIKELPKEIGALQKLEILDIKNSSMGELPKEIGSLEQLKTLEMTNTSITLLPKEMGKLQHLEHLIMNRTNVKKIPREIGLLKELKSFQLDSKIAALPLEICHVSGAFVKFPECILQALKKSDELSELAAEMLSFQQSGGLVVGAKQMHIPSWIKEHFNDIKVLDIRICKLDEQGLKILREMPQLWNLTLRFDVVPREPVVISSQGFAELMDLTIDSRVPRVTFQKDAMPSLKRLTFWYQFYAGPPNSGPVGINHLWSLSYIYFECNQDWYGGGDSPCIRPTIDVVKKESQEHHRGVCLYVCGHQEETWSPSPSPPPPLEMGHQREIEEAGWSSGCHWEQNRGGGIEPQREIEEEEWNSGNHWEQNQGWGMDQHEIKEEKWSSGNHWEQNQGWGMDQHEIEDIQA